MPLMRLLPAGVLACALVATSATAAAAHSVEDAPSYATVSASAASTDYEQVVDLTYPTAEGTTYRDDYDASRGGGTRAHRATDIFGSMGQKIYAAEAGTIVWMPGQDPADKHASAGYGMQVRTGDGRLYAYYHLGPDSGGPDEALAAGLEKGDRVARGQHLGYLGDSGNAAGGSPHLHFEIHDAAVADPYGSNRINPYFSLRDAERRGDYPLGVAPISNPPAPDDGADPLPDPHEHVDRVAGDHRVATAVELSKKVFSSADHVVLAAAGSFADSVAAGPLAAQHDGPVLTTRGSRLEPVVVEEIKRLGATRATVVGGDAAVPAAVETDLVERAALRPSRVDRLSGEDRYATAVTIAEAVWASQETRRAGVALGTHEQQDRAWPDALTAGYHGAVTGAPVLLVTPGGVPAATAAALEGVAEVTVVGGGAVVSDEVYTQVDAHAGQVRRIAGPDRYMTAAAVAEDLLAHGVSSDRVWAATGRSFADALAAAPAVAASNEALLLIDGADGGRDRRLEEWLRGRAADIHQGRVIGGAAAVNDDALRRFAEHIR